MEQGYISFLILSHIEGTVGDNQDKWTEEN